MGRWQGRSKRKLTGGRRRAFSGKKLREMGSFPTETKIADVEKRRFKRMRGGHYRVRLLTASHVNLLDPETGKAQRVKIKSVELNPASRDLSRRQIITKGAIIETELGKARVTSRPGIHGVVNAVLIKEE